MMTRSRIRRNRGPSLPGRRPGRIPAYLLLELAIAMVLLSVAMVGLIDGFRAVMGVRLEQNRRTLARILLESKLEEMEYDGAFREGVQEGVFPMNDRFRWQSECMRTEIEGLYRVNLTVTWASGSFSSLSFLRESLQ